MNNNEHICRFLKNRVSKFWVLSIFVFNSWLLLESAESDWSKGSGSLVYGIEEGSGTVKYENPRNEFKERNKLKNRSEPYPRRSTIESTVNNTNTYMDMSEIAQNKKEPIEKELMLEENVLFSNNDCMPDFSNLGDFFMNEWKDLETSSEIETISLKENCSSDEYILLSDVHNLFSGIPMEEENFLSDIPSSLNLESSSTLGLEVESDSIYTLDQMNQANTTYAEESTNPQNPQNPENLVNPVNPENLINPENKKNSINSVESTNPENTVNPVDSTNLVNPINLVNQENPVNTVNRVNPMNPGIPIYQTISIRSVNLPNQVSPINQTQTVKIANSTNQVNATNSINPMKDANHKFPVSILPSEPIVTTVNGSVVVPILLPLNASVGVSNEFNLRHNPIIRKTCYYRALECGNVFSQKGDTKQQRIFYNPETFLPIFQEGEYKKKGISERKIMKRLSYTIQKLSLYSKKKNTENEISFFKDTNENKEHIKCGMTFCYDHLGASQSNFSYDILEPLKPSSSLEKEIDKSTFVSSDSESDSDSEKEDEETEEGEEDNKINKEILEEIQKEDIHIFLKNSANVESLIEHSSFISRFYTVYQISKCLDDYQPDKIMNHLIDFLISIKKLNTPENINIPNGCHIMRKFFYSIEKNINFFIDPKNYNNDFAILDSMVFFKMYFSLVLVLMSKLLKREIGYIRNRLKKKKKHISTLPQNGTTFEKLAKEPLSASVRLKFAEETASIHITRNILKYVLLLFKEDDYSEYKITETYMDVFHNYLTELYDKYMILYKNIFDINRISKLEFFGRFDQEDCNMFFTVLNDLIYCVFSMQQNIKQLIRKNFSDKSTFLNFIYYRYGVLLFHRILIATSEESDRVEFLRVLKELLNLCENLMMKEYSTSEFSFLSPEDVLPLKRKDNVIYLITLYSQLHILRLFAMQVKTSMNRIIYLTNGYMFNEFHRSDHEYIEEIIGISLEIKENICNMEMIFSFITKKQPTMKDIIYFYDESHVINERVDDMVKHIENVKKSLSGKTALLNIGSRMLEEINKSYNALFERFNIGDTYNDNLLS